MEQITGTASHSGLSMLSSNNRLFYSKRIIREQPRMHRYECLQLPREPNALMQTLTTMPPLRSFVFLFSAVSVNNFANVPYPAHSSLLDGSKPFHPNACPTFVEIGTSRTEISLRNPHNARILNAHAPIHAQSAHTHMLPESAWQSVSS